MAELKNTLVNGTLSAKKIYQDGVALDSKYGNSLAISLNTISLKNADGTAISTLTLPAGSCAVRGGELTINSNYSGTPTISTSISAQTTSGAAYTTTKPSSSYYITLAESTAKLSGTTKVTRAAVTDAHTAGYIPAKSATTAISSASSSPTVTVNAAKKTGYITLPAAAFTYNGLTTSTSTNTGILVARTAGYSSAETTYITALNVPSGRKHPINIINGGAIEIVKNYGTVHIIDNNSTHASAVINIDADSGTTNYLNWTIAQDSSGNLTFVHK